MRLNEALFATLEKTDCLHSSLMWLKYNLTELQEQTLYRMLCVVFQLEDARGEEHGAAVHRQQRPQKPEDQRRPRRLLLWLTGRRGGRGHRPAGPQHFLWVDYTYTPVLLSVLTSASSVSWYIHHSSCQCWWCGGYLCLYFSFFYLLFTPPPHPSVYWKLLWFMTVCVCFV